MPLGDRGRWRRACTHRVPLFRPYIRSMAISVLVEALLDHHTAADAYPRLLSLCTLRFKICGEVVGLHLAWCKR